MRTATMTRAFSVLAILALVVAACGPGDGEEAQPGDTPADGDEPVSITIGWTPPDITGVFRTATDFFEQSAEEANQNGFDVEITSRSPETHEAYADQLAIVEDFITQQVDVIAISPADTEALRPGLQQANEAGIPVIMVNLLEEQEGLDIASFIGFDNADAARVSAYSILDYFGGPGVLGEGEEVDVEDDAFLDLEFWEDTYADADPEAIEASGLIIEGIAGTFFSNARLEGFSDVMDEYPNVEILADPEPGDWNRDEGISVTEDYLSRFSEGEADFIWAASNEMGIGASLATAREDRLDDSGGASPPGEGISIFTNDVTPESVEMIRDGEIIAETHHGFAEWGWFGTETAVRIACGLEVEQFQDIRPRTAWEGNAELFYPDPELPEIDWQQIRADCER